MKRILLTLAVMAATVACAKGTDVINVIPEPANVTLCHGTYNVAGAQVTMAAEFDEASQNYASAFAAQLAKISGEGNGKIAFEYNPALGNEAYTIDVTASGVTVGASALNGVVYAVQTIKQLLPVAIYGDEPAFDAEWTLPRMKVADEPRFAYRGMHLDPCRHFFSVEETKRYLDMMEMHKLNTLHWHLTEDQGWRVEIKKYPKLTEIGSKRAQTIIGHTKKYDGIPYGGFYTQDEIRDVVAYAAARGITIIPELDLPGHMQAALAAYPELGCTGGPYKVWERWGISEDVLCVGQEKTFEFLQDVIKELCDLFPGEYFHIGGDECPKVRWHDCPRCKAKMAELGFKDENGYKAEDYLQSYVTRRMEDYLATLGRKIIGWDEVLQGEVSPNAIVMSWRGTKGGIAAAQLGHDVIMTPNTYCYFDYLQSKDASTEPIAIGGYVPVDMVYNYEPYDESMTEEQCSHILGVQANMWTEYVAEPWHLEYMVLPRQAALAEVQWCAPERKNWSRFHADLPHLCAIYDVRGYTYAKHALDPEFGEQPTNRTVSHKAVGKEATALTEAHYAYCTGNPENLFDGKLADGYYQADGWIGYWNSPMVVAVKLGGKKVRSVTLSTLVDKNSYIFNVTSVRVSVSSDGENYTEVAYEEFPADLETTRDDPRDVTVTFPAVKAKYMKIEAATIDVLPEWHPGAGEAPFTFYDEIIIN